MKLTVAEPAPIPMLPPMLIDRFLSPGMAKLLAAQLWAAADHAEERAS